VSGRPWIVTRPAAAGSALTAALSDAGQDARWLPAFDLGPAPDPALARATLEALARFDLALFVSPAAVRATGQLLGERTWPPATMIGAVGSGTREAVRAHLRGADRATVIAPIEAGADVNDSDGQTGSEAFWLALTTHRQQTGNWPQRALLLRAEQGRDWLRDRLAEVGAEVVTLAAYARRIRPWTDDDSAWVAARLPGPPPLLVIPSSEAVDSVLAAARAQPAAAAVTRWLQRGRALALHPRIVARLHAAGFDDVACVTCEIDALLAAADG
jgi:uroporphyrinogen-III synthase